MEVRLVRRVSDDAGKALVGLAFASFSHTTWTCALDEPARDRRAETESQYAAFGFRITLAAWPPTAQSTIRTRGLRREAALAFGMNA